MLVTVHQHHRHQTKLRFPSLSQVQEPRNIHWITYYRDLIYDHDDKEIFVRFLKERGVIKQHKKLLRSVFIYVYVSLMGLYTSRWGLCCYTTSNARLKFFVKARLSSSSLSFSSSSITYQICKREISNRRDIF